MNLRTVFHLFRTDVRRLRWLILITWFLFAVDFAICLSASGWRAPGTRSSSSGDAEQHYRESAPKLWRVGGFTAMLVAGAAGWQGLAWSRTRPVRRREAAAAKTGFVLTFLILPQMAMVATVLLYNGIPWRESLLGMLAAAGVFAPLWCMMMALGRLAGSGAAFFMGLVFIAGGAGIAGLFDERMLFNFWMALGDPWGQYAGPHSWYFLGTCAAALLLLLPLIARRWKTPARLLTAAGVVVGSGYYWRYTDWFHVSGDYFEMAAQDSAVFDKVTPVPPVTRLDGSEPMDRGKRVISVSGMFGTEGLPPDVFAWWQPSGEALLRSEGKVIARAKSRFIKEGRPQIQSLFPPQQTPMNEAAVLAALPREGRLVKDQMQGIHFSFEKSPQELGLFVPEDPGIGFSGRQVSLEADMTGILYRYEVVADVPLAEESIVRRGAVHMQVRLAAETVPPRDPLGQPGYLQSVRADIGVQCPALGVSDDVLTLTWMMPPVHAWRVFLYTPATGWLVEGRNIFSASSPLLGGGGTHRRIYGFEGVPRVLREEDASRARFIILQPKLLGFSTKRVVTPPAPLKMHDPGSGDYPMLTQRRWAPGNSDPATATREEFGLWLREHLLFDGHESFTEALVRWMPRWPDVILNIRPWTTDYEFEWCAAATRALPDSRREEVFRRLPNAPWLTWVIHRRGWEHDGKEELLKLFYSGHTMNMAGLLSVASLEDPATYDRLLAFMEEDGKVELYEVLRRLPGIEPRLTETVQRYFARITVHGREPVEVPTHADSLAWKLGVPLLHGMPEALRDLLAIFRGEAPVRNGKHSSTASSRSGYILDHLIRPPGLKPASEEAYWFLRDLKAEDCRFDPLTRRWITPGANP